MAFPLFYVTKKWLLPLQTVDKGFDFTMLASYGMHACKHRGFRLCKVDLSLKGQVAQRPFDSIQMDGIESLGTTKGLSDRPLETFGPIRIETFAG